MVLWQVLPSFNQSLIYFRLKLHFTLTAERGQVGKELNRYAVENDHSVGARALSISAFFHRKRAPHLEYYPLD